MSIRSKNVVRGKFPKVYEYNHPESGTYYLVDVFTIAPILSGGSKRTVHFSEKHKNPWFTFQVQRKTSLKYL